MPLYSFSEHAIAICMCKQFLQDYTLRTKHTVALVASNAHAMIEMGSASLSSLTTDFQPSREADKSSLVVPVPGAYKVHSSR